MAKVAIRRSVTASSLLTGLVSYWKLDETNGTRYDAHGSNDLTPTPTLGYGTGKIGNAARFVDGSDDYAYITETPTDLNFNQTSFTIAFWYYPYTFPPAEFNYHQILHNWSQSVELDPQGQPAWFHRGYWIMTATNPAVACCIGGGWAPAPVIHIEHLTLNTWQFIIFEHDLAANQIVGSRNLVVKDTQTSHGVLPSVEAMFRIGSYTPTPSYQDGLLDEFGMWSRVLTADEKTALYNAGAGSTYPFAGV